MSRISLAIVDDNELVLEGLKALLACSPDIDLLYATTHADALMGFLAKEQPQVVLMDIQMPECNGFDLCTRLVAQYPAIKIVAFSSFDDPQYVQQLLEIGASGYILKNADQCVLLGAIRAVAAGQKFVEIAVTTKQAPEISALPKRAATEMPLTKRERDILQLLAQEHNQQDIAALLLMPARTVDLHFQHLCMKLGTSDKGVLVQEASKRGLII